MLTAYAMKDIPEDKFKSIEFLVHINNSYRWVAETIKNTLDTLVKYDDLAIKYDPLGSKMAYCTIEVLESTDTDRFIEQLNSKLVDGLEVSAVRSSPKCR